MRPLPGVNPRPLPGVKPHPLPGVKPLPLPMLPLYERGRGLRLRWERPEYSWHVSVSKRSRGCFVGAGREGLRGSGGGVAGSSGGRVGPASCCEFGHRSVGRRGPSLTTRRRPHWPQRTPDKGRSHTGQAHTHTHTQTRSYTHKWETLSFGDAGKDSLGCQTCKKVF